MIVDALALFLASFVVVFALGLQQMNVAGGHTGLAFATSLIIGAATIVQFKVLPGPTGALTLVAYLIGGATGIVASMHAHPELLRRLAMWRLSRGRMTRVQARANALGERLGLAVTIARASSVSDIESFCPAMDFESTVWWDTTRAGGDHPESVDETARNAVDLAVRFLDCEASLIHHPTVHTLVRFKP